MKASQTSVWAVVLLSAALASGKEPMPGQLLRHCTWVRPEVAGGRIVALNLHRAPNRVLTAEHVSSKESLALNPGGEEPRLLYQFMSDNRHWQCEYREPATLTITDRRGERTLRFEQSPEQSLKLTIERDESTEQSYSARTLWHLLILDAAARDHLLPQLAMVSSAWNLGERANKIEDRLFEEIEGRWPEQRLHWEHCLARLASSDYKSRLEAERELIKGDAAAAGYLQEVDRSRLTAHQRRRIDCIVPLASEQTDDAARVAASWVYDQHAWCQLLHHEDPERRAEAGNHLAQLLGRSITFDPAAAAIQRTAQVNVIRDTLLKR